MERNSRDRFVDSTLSRSESGSLNAYRLLQGILLRVVEPDQWFGHSFLLEPNRPGKFEVNITRSSTYTGYDANRRCITFQSPDVSVNHATIKFITSATAFQLQSPFASSARLPVIPESPSNIFRSSSSEEADSPGEICIRDNFSDQGTFLLRKVPFMDKNKESFAIIEKEVRP